MRVHQQVVAIVVSMVAVGGEVWGANRKTKNGKKNPTTEVPAMVGGCRANFAFWIKNKLDVALYAQSSTTSHGTLDVPGCNNCKVDKTCTYSNCMNIPPNGTQYFDTKDSSACQGVEGKFIYGPSNSTYTAQTGLESIELHYKDGGGPNGKLIHTQQFNMISNPTGYEFGQTIAPGSCPNPRSCVETFTVEIIKSPPVPDSVKEYDGSWASIASGGTVGISAGTSWTNEQSSSIGTSFESGFTEGVSAKFGVTKVTAGASQEMGKTSSDTISQSNSGSYGVSCDSNPCNGRLYQWQTAAEYIEGPTQIVKSCFFTCVPDTTHPGPQCPYGFCASDGCQCCNAVWIKDNNNPTDNRLAPSAGGTCKSTCKANTVRCSNDEECCTGTCNIGGSLPTGGTCQ